MSLTLKHAIPFALNADGEIRLASEVPNGLKCDCVCVECGTGLIARNEGQKRVAHFAHAAVESSCGGGLESGIHMLAKRVITEARKLNAHAAEPEVRRTDKYGEEHVLTGDRIPAEWLCFDSVRCEVNVAIERESKRYIRPDVIGEMIIEGSMVRTI